MSQEHFREHLKHLGVPMYSPDIEFGNEPDEDETYEMEPLPDDHPCRDCIALRTDCGVPYCFLPRCDKETFNRKEDAE